MSKEKEINYEEKLENVDGGHVSPTWQPVDESCPVCNKVDECPFSARKGFYDNCSGCKAY